MERARLLKDQYEEVRKLNINEWNSFATELKQRIADHQVKVTDYQCQYDALTQLQQSVKEKQKLYDKKHEDFQTKYQEIKTMDDKDIIKLIQEEEERVIKRREQIEATIKENNEKFDLLVIKKGKLMDAASKIMLDEKAIEEQGKQVSELGMQCQSIQDKLVHIKNSLPTASAEEKSKMVAEAPDLQKSLQDQYENYQKFEKDYRIKLEMHNHQRRELHEQMTSLDQEAMYGKQINDVIHIRIQEVNQQIQMLNSKKTSFKSSTDYLHQTRTELIAFREEINKEIEEIQVKATALNELGLKLRKEE